MSISKGKGLERGDKRRWSMRRREFLEMRRLPRRGRPHRGGVKPEGDEGSYFANLTPAEERLNFARPKGRLLAAEKHREKNQDREDSET